MQKERIPRHPTTVLLRPPGVTGMSWLMDRLSVTENTLRRWRERGQIQRLTEILREERRRELHAAAVRELGAALEGSSGVPPNELDGYAEIFARWSDREPDTCLPRLRQMLPLLQAGHALAAGRSAFRPRRGPAPPGRDLHGARDGRGRGHGHPAGPGAATPRILPLCPRRRPPRTRPATASSLSSAAPRARSGPDAAPIARGRGPRLAGCRGPAFA